jgi:ribosome biogenesis protein ERB1
MLRRELDDDYDSSEDEEPDTVGNIPHEWYDEYDHIGYDHEGKRIAKATGLCHRFFRFLSF